MPVLHRLMPPTVTGWQTMAANGRTYTCAIGSVLDVPNFDANVLEANGWSFVAISGTSSDRPAPSTNPIGPEGAQAGPGTKYFDTTLDELIVCDGVTWRSPVDGSAV